MKKTLLALLINACCALSLSGVSSLNIITNDGQQFTYTKDVELAALRQSETINNFISDFEDQDDIVIPLPVIDAACWHNIEQCLDLQYAKKNIADFLGKLDRDNLYAFINGINYLNNADLLDNALEEWLNNHELTLFEEGDSTCQFNEHIKELLQEKTRRSLIDSLATDKQKPVTCQKFSGHSTANFSPNGKFVALRSSNVFDTTLKIWDTQMQALTQMLRHTSRLNAVCFSPDSNLIASGSSEVKIWDLATGESVQTLTGHTSEVKIVVFSPDGNFLASGSNDATIRIWNVQTGELVHILNGHTGWIRSIFYSIDGKCVVTGSDDETVRIWETTSGNCINTLSVGSITSMSCSPDGDSIAVGLNNGTIDIWSLSSANRIHTLKGHSDLVRAICYSPDGKFIASGSNDSTLRIWDSKTGNPIHILQGDSSWVTSICYSPRGDFIAAGSGAGLVIPSGASGTVRIWAAHKGELIHTLKKHSGLVSSMSFSPDSDFIVSGSYDRTVCIWNFTCHVNQLIKKCTPEQHSLLALGFQKKKNNQPLILNKYLQAQFDQFDSNQQDLIKKILPLQLIASSSTV